MDLNLDFVIKEITFYKINKISAEMEIVTR
jgi:hypothetical protein